MLGWQPMNRKMLIALFAVLLLLPVAYSNVSQKALADDLIYGATQAEQAAKETANQFPVARVLPTKMVNTAPYTVTLDGTSSFDPDGSISKYSWDIQGDMKEGATVPYTFTSEGSYAVKLTVADNKGAKDFDYGYVIVLSQEEFDSRKGFEYERSEERRVGKEC